MNPPHLKHSMRNAVIAIFVIAGGLLQYAFTSTSHPSTILKAWEVFYGVVVFVLAVVVIVWLAIRGVESIKRRRA